MSFRAWSIVVDAAMLEPLASLASRPLACATYLNPVSCTPISSLSSDTLGVLQGLSTFCDLHTPQALLGLPGPDNIALTLSERKNVRRSVQRSMSVLEGIKMTGKWIWKTGKFGRVRHI